MSKTLSPEAPMVEQGKLLNLLVTRDANRMTHKQFIVLQTFDYGVILESIRGEGLLKSEDVFQRLYEVLIARDLIKPVDSCILDVGSLGRPSKAIQDHYRFKLNHSCSLMKTLIEELNNVFLTFTGPEGEIHLLKDGGIDVVGHVLVSMDEGTGLYSDTTLDLIGPSTTEFPEDFDQQLSKDLLQYLSENHPGLAITLTVKVRRSELALATGAFLC